MQNRVRETHIHTTLSLYLFREVDQRREDNHWDEQDEYQQEELPGTGFQGLPDHLHATEVLEESKQPEYSHQSQNEQKVQHVRLRKEVYVELDYRDQVDPGHGALEEFEDIGAAA